MTETTTIQVRKDQAEQLKEIQGPSGNYKTAIDTVLESYSQQQPATKEDIQTVLSAIEMIQNEPVAEIEVDHSEVIGKINDLKNSLPKDIAKEVRR